MICERIGETFEELEGEKEGRNVSERMDMGFSKTI